MREEALVEFIRHVVADAPKLEIEGGDTDEARGVATSGDGDFDERDLGVEDFEFLLGDAESVDFVEVGGGFEFDDEVESFLWADRGESVEVGDVDDADAAHFEITAGEVFGGGGEFTADLFEVYDVVRDEGSSFFEESDGGFTFSRSARPHDENADATVVDHAAMKKGARGELFLELYGGGIEDRHGGARGVDDGDVSVPGDGAQVWAELVIAGDNDAGEILLAKLREALDAEIIAKFFEV